MITVKYLNSGWNDKNFEKKLQALINIGKSENLEYYDIKISSSGNHSMIVFKQIKQNI